MNTTSQGDSATVVDVERRLNWGCGAKGEPGWINADLKDGPGIQISGDIRDGLSLDDNSIDYIVSIHALNMIPLPEVVPVLNELKRVLRPGGTLRLAVPNLNKSIAAYLKGDHAHFLIPDDDASSLSGKLITYLVWHGYTTTFFTPEFIEELLVKAGFSAIHHCAHRITQSRYPAIVDLDNRENESLFVEAVK